MRFVLLALTCLAAIVVADDEASTDINDDKALERRAIDDGSDAAGAAGNKFKIYVGTIDGVRREVFNEVDGGEENVQPESSFSIDPFSAYDDNNVITTENEKSLFVPKPYRPGGDKTKKPTTTTTTRAPFTTTIRTIPFIQTTPFRPQPQFNRPPPPTAPPRVFPPQPIQPFHPQPQTFRPVPQTFNTQPPPPPQNFNTAPPPPPPQFTRAPFRPQPPSQPQQPRFPPQQPFVSQPQPQPHVAQTTPRPSPPFAGAGGSLRSGQCRASVFYISTPITGPSRLTFTHFAVAVTVDQCARTCHEFNCAIAHYNPLNGHCEFNPSTSFAIRNGQCPAWPSLHYRNNVVANEPVRIFCVTCQRPRRRPFGQRRQLTSGRRTTGRRGQRAVRKPVEPQVVLASQDEEHESHASVQAVRTSVAASHGDQLSLLRQLEDLQL